MNDVITNASILDVCFKDGADKYFCSRYVCLTIITCFTAILCLGKVIRYHYRNLRCWYQLSIFYCAFGECVFFALHFVVLPYDFIENVGYWLRVIQLVIVCYLYSILAIRAVYREEQYWRRFVLPFLALFSLYYAALIPWIFAAPRYRYPHKCTEFSHPVYTISDFLLSQGFLFCGTLLTRKMGQVSIPSEQLLEQKRQLWSVIIMFEVEAIISIVYDILLATVASGPRGCGGFLYQHNVASVITFVVVRSLRLFAAIWCMLYMFDAQSSDYSEPAQYYYADDDSFDEYNYGPRSNSIVPYARDTNYDIQQPLLSENVFEDYLPDDEERFGESTHKKLHPNSAP